MAAGVAPSGDPPRAGRGRRSAAAGWRLLSAVALLIVSLEKCSADVSGSAVLTGKPNSQDETFYAKANGCGESAIRHTENWKIGPKGELGDVVVWVIDPKYVSAEAKPEPPEIEIKQIGCRYIPHVAAVWAGHPFKIINGDPTLHNIRAKVAGDPGAPPGADVFNFGQARQGQVDERQFDDPGIYLLRCDVHAWMQAWVRALPTRSFAVTDTDGKFTLYQDVSMTLADGDYKIDAWHPRFADVLEQTVHVTHGSATVRFQFDGAKSF